MSNISRLMITCISSSLGETFINGVVYATLHKALNPHLRLCSVYVLCVCRQLCLYVRCYAKHARLINIDYLLINPVNTDVLYCSLTEIGLLWRQSNGLNVWSFLRVDEYASFYYWP